MAKKKSTVKKADEELKDMGFTHKKVAGIIIVIIGLLLVVGNIASALLAIVGLILIYFGLRFFGYKISLNEMLNEKPEKSNSA